jgi:hypothetical protein
MFSESEQRQVLDEMRSHGGELFIGGGRAHVTYRWKAGAWLSEDFDEGATNSRPETEESVLAALSRHPESGRALLHKATLREAGSHWRAGNWAKVLTSLETALEYGVRGLLDRPYALILRAVAGWPRRQPTREELEEIEKVGYGVNQALYRLFPGEKDRALAEMGLEYNRRLIEIVGKETEELRISRKAFENMM